MKKVFITLAVIMMVGLMATAAMAAQGADRIRPGGAAIVDYFQCSDAPIETMIAINNILQHNWIEVSIIYYDSNSVRIVSDAITLSPGKVVAISIVSDPGATTAHANISMLSADQGAGGTRTTTLSSDKWTVGGLKTGYMTLVVQRVGQGNPGVGATTPGAWAPIFGGSNTLAAHWGIAPDAMIVSVYYLNRQENHGEGLNAMMIQGFENLPNVTTSKYNWDNPYITLFGRDVAFNSASAGSIDGINGGISGFTAADSTSAAGIPGPGKNILAFAEYPDLSYDNGINVNFGNNYGGLPKQNVTAPNVNLHYNAAPTKAVMTSGLMAQYARVPGAKSIFNDAFTPFEPAISTVDFFNWRGTDASAVGFADQNEDGVHTAIDSFELYLTDGWGNIIIGPSPAPIDAGPVPALVPYPILSLRAAQRFIRDSVNLVYSDLVACFPASDNSFPYRNNAKMFRFLCWNTDEQVNDSTRNWTELGRAKFDYGTSLAVVPILDGSNQGWVSMTSGAGGQISYKFGLPFTGFIVTYTLAASGQRFSALHPLFDIGSENVGSVGNASNQLLATGGGLVNGQGPAVAIGNLNSEPYFGPATVTNLYANAAYSTIAFDCNANFANGLPITALGHYLVDNNIAYTCGPTGQGVATTLPTNPPQKPQPYNGTLSGGTVNSDGNPGEVMKATTNK
jgi:hypothetical protein